MKKDKIRLAPATNPSPSNGDIWFDGTVHKKRAGGVTTDLDTTGGSGSTEYDYGLNIYNKRYI